MLNRQQDVDDFTERSTKETSAEQFGKFVSSLNYSDIPREVVRTAALHLLDTIGVGIAATVLPHEAESSRAAATVLQDMGGRQEGSVIGDDRMVPAASAAFANAALCHSLDFDDVHTDSRAHISAVVAPAALALGERQGATGREVLTAMVAGNEIATRIGMGGPWHFQTHGFHSTPVCGVFGAAASAASLLGLDEAETTHALGIAGDTASGTNAWIAEGTTNKHLHPGWAAHNGILSAMFAGRGARGPRGVFEGRFGLYEALAGAKDVSLEGVLSTLGVNWETPKMAFKAYPTCYWVHGSVESMAHIRDEVLRHFDDIELIQAIVPSAAVPIVLEPRATRIYPPTPYAAKFSMQYSIAAMLLRGAVDLNTYTQPLMSDERVLDLAARVEWTVSATFDAGPQVYPGGVRVRFRDGRELSAEVIDPPGTVENPMPEEDILRKFRSNAGFGLESSDVATLETALTHLQEAESVSLIAGLLRRVRVQ